MTQVLRVSRDQVESARLLIKLSGGEDHVEPLIVQIANAEPAPPVQAQAQGQGQGQASAPGADPH